MKHLANIVKPINLIGGRMTYSLVERANKSQLISDPMTGKLIKNTNINNRKQFQLILENFFPEK